MLEEKKLNKFNMYLYMFSYTLILMNTMLGQIKLISGILSTLSDISIILLIFKCVIQSQKYKENCYVDFSHINCCYIIIYKIK